MTILLVKNESGDIVEFDTDLCAEGDVFEFYEKHSDYVNIGSVLYSGNTYPRTDETLVFNAPTSPTFDATHILLSFAVSTATGFSAAAGDSFLISSVKECNGVGPLNIPFTGVNYRGQDGESNNNSLGVVAFPVDAVDPTKVTVVWDRRAEGANGGFIGITVYFNGYEKIPTGA